MANHVDPKRLERCEELYLTGIKPRAIERQLAKELGVCKRTVRNYLAKVRERLGTAFAGEDPGAVRSRAESMLLDAYNVAKEKGDGGTMARIAMQLAELHGAHVPAHAFKGSVAVEGVGDLLGRALAPAAGAPSGAAR